MNLKLSDIRRDNSAQPRAMLNTDHIKDLSDALEDGGDLTPVDVFHDGFSYWLADGFHRYSAYHRAKRDEIPVTIHEGNLRDAVLYSITANTQHSVLKLTREEKRVSVTRLLKDEEWGRWSNREIARRAGVTDKTVGVIRQELADCKTLQSDDPSAELTAEFRSEPSEGVTGKSSSELTERTYTTKHGTPAKMQTSNIGKPKADPPAPPVEPAQVEPPAVVSEPAPPRHLKTYSPPLTPDTVEEDELPEEVDDETDLESYRPSYVKPIQDFQPRQFTDSAPVPAFEQVYMLLGKLRGVSEQKMVVALNSEQNRVPVEGALQDQMRDLITKLERCMALAEQGRKTVTI